MVFRCVRGRPDKWLASLCLGQAGQAVGFDVFGAGRVNRWRFAVFFLPDKQMVFRCAWGRPDKQLALRSALTIVA